MSKKQMRPAIGTYVVARSLGSGKYEVSVGLINGLAERDGNDWTLSPNLRGLPKAATEILIRRLNTAHADSES